MQAPSTALQHTLQQEAPHPGLLVGGMGALSYSAAPSLSHLTHGTEEGSVSLRPSVPSVVSSLGHSIGHKTREF